MISTIRSKIRQFIFKDFMLDLDDSDHDIKQSAKIDMPDPLTFKVQPAQGGTIVEVQSWDNKDDIYVTNLHIIPEGTDVASAVGSIVMMELLRRN